MLVALLLTFFPLVLLLLLLFQVRHTNIMINYICLFIIYNSSDFLLCVCRGIICQRVESRTPHVGYS